MRLPTFFHTRAEGHAHTTGFNGSYDAHDANGEQPTICAEPVVLTTSNGVHRANDPSGVTGVTDPHASAENDGSAIAADGSAFHNNILHATELTAVAGARASMPTDDTDPTDLRGSDDIRDHAMMALPTVDQTTPRSTTGTRIDGRSNKPWMSPPDDNTGSQHALHVPSGVTENPPAALVPAETLAAMLTTLGQIDIDIPNLLLSIAWLGEVHSRHVHWTWMPSYSARSVNRLRMRLEADGLITCRWFYRRRRNKSPVRYGKLWSLTPAGLQFVKLLPNAPLRLLKLRSLDLANHDTMTTEITLRIIAHARAAGLSGVYLDREALLNPPHRKPTMDAVLSVRTGGIEAPPFIIPWTADPPVPGERVRKYAIENDRDSEVISIIMGKAYAYQQAATGGWVTRNGQFPIPLWVVPTEKRREVIMEAWRTVWPRGKWLMTTDAALAHDRWLEYYNGRVRERSLFIPAVGA